MQLFPDRRILANDLEAGSHLALEIGMQATDQLSLGA